MIRAGSGSRRTTTYVIVLAAYTIVSIACSKAAGHPAIKPLVEQCWAWIWLLGPPITLIHGTGYLWVYAVGSILLATFVIAAERAWDRWPGVTLLCVALAIAVWCVSGILVYAPTL
jgi:hypothetical protein